MSHRGELLGYVGLAIAFGLLAIVFGILLVQAARHVCWKIGRRGRHG